MKKPIEWESVINDKNYTFAYQRIKGKHTLTVNGNSTTIKSGFMSALFGFDEEFNLDGTAARLVIENKKPDIVVDGVYIQSGKKYVKRPAWVIAYVIICVAIPIVSLGGAIPALLGFAGATVCISVSKSTLPLPARLIICTLITIAAWILLFVLALGVDALIG